jgi:hypothetical protein
MGMVFSSPAPAEATASHEITWLAAGDSYASGAGLTHTTKGCARATDPSQAWAQVAQQVLSKEGFSFGTPDFVACTEAKTGEFFAPQGKNPAEWTPRMKRYDLVTFSFGGDDVGFASIIEACYEGTSLCTDKAVRDRVAAVASSYPAFLKKVATRAVSKDGNVVVMGYPELVEGPGLWPVINGATLQCQGLSRVQAERIRGWAGDLNATIGNAVNSANALPASVRNGVHFTFVDVVTGQTTNGIGSSDPFLFEPVTGTRHELCSQGDASWLNGVSPFHPLTRSIHPNQAGETAMGNLAAEVIGRLTWPWVPSEAAANSELAALTDGMSESLVAVPGGYEAATWDQLGDIDFWKLTGAGPWVELRRSTYPILGSASQNPPDASATGTLLSGMSDATFILDGTFSGDGTGNAVVYGPGPDGYGALSQENTSLASTGQGASGTGFDYFQALFQNGELVTEQNSGAFDNAFGAGFPIVMNWHWNGQSFVSAGNNVVTAQAASAPPLNAQPIPSASPSNGVYAVEIIGASEVPNGSLGTTDQVSLALVPSCSNLISACQVPGVPPNGFSVTVAANTPTVYPEDAPGSTYDTVRYVTGPAWPIAGFAALWGEENAGGITNLYVDTSTWDQQGTTPWYIPPALVLANSDIAVGANVSGEVTFQGGQITNIFIDDPLGG